VRVHGWRQPVSVAHLPGNACVVEPRSRQHRHEKRVDIDFELNRPAECRVMLVRLGSEGIASHWNRSRVLPYAAWKSALEVIQTEPVRKGTGGVQPSRNAHVRALSGCQQRRVVP